MSISIRFILLFSIIVANPIRLSCQSFSAMTYNIRYSNPDDGENWWEHRKSDVVTLIKYYSPDFLGIQEGLYAQVEYLDLHCGDHTYVGVGRDDGKTKGEYTALYYDSTKFDLIADETFWLSGIPEIISVGWDASMERICTYGHFRSKTSNIEIHIFNAHFDHIGPVARANSAKLILKKISDFGLLEKQVIVMGDFNCLPTSEPILNFKSLLDDSGHISETGIYGPDGTFNQFDPDLTPENRIDYILSKNLKVISYRNIEDRRKNKLWPSDHLPVFAIFSY